MHADIDILRHTRRNMLAAIDGLTDTQLQHIPTGSKNNILWNIGHNIITQQLLCYHFSGNELPFLAEYAPLLRKASSPADWDHVPDINQLREIAISSVDRLEDDSTTDIFSDYQSYSTSYGVTLDSIDDAIRFNNVHEGVHLGIIFSLKHQIPSS